MKEKTYFEALLLCAVLTMIVAASFLAFNLYAVFQPSTGEMGPSTVQAQFHTHTELKAYEGDIILRGKGNVIVYEHIDSIKRLGIIQRIYKFAYVFFVALLFALGLRKVLKEDVFNKSLVYLTHGIGALCIVYPIGKWALELLASQEITENANITGIQFGASFDAAFLAAGFMLIVVGELFRYGYNLQEEQKLTV